MNSLPRALIALTGPPFGFRDLWFLYLIAASVFIGLPLLYIVVVIRHWRRVRRKKSQSQRDANTP